MRFKFNMNGDHPLFNLIKQCNDTECYCDNCGVLDESECVMELIKQMNSDVRDSLLADIRREYFSNGYNVEQDR